MSKVTTPPATLLERLIANEEGDPAGASPLVDAMMAERLYRLSKPTRYVPYAFMAAFFAGFWPVLQAWQMVAVFMLYSAGTLWFDRLRRDFAARPDRLSGTDRWTGRFALASLATGSCWGLLCWFCFVPGDFNNQLMLAFAVGGLCTCTVLTRSIHMPSFYAFLIPTMGPALLLCVYEGSAASLVIAAFGVIFGSFLALWAHAAHRGERRAAALRLRNAELIAEVDAARAMAEAARDVAEANYRKTLDSLENAQRIGNIGNMDWDATTRTLFWSDQFYRLLGLHPHSIRPSSATFMARVHADDRERLLSHVDRLRGEAAQGHVEFRVVDPGGEQRILSAVAEAVHDADGRLLRIAATLRDITQQRRYEHDLIAAKAAAERASLAKSNLLGNLSHELRTPLNAIIGFAEMLALPQLRQAGADRVAEYSSLILGSGRQLLTLIEDLLDIAQIETDRLALTLDTVDLAGVTAEAIARVQPALDKAGCSIAAMAAAPAGSLVADRQRLLQILSILLEEAIRHAPPASRLTLQAATEGAMLHLAITAPRLPAAALQAKDAATPLRGFEEQTPYEPGDLGLRLAIARDLVLRHQGRLEIDAAPAGDTAIHLWLPADGPI